MLDTVPEGFKRRSFRLDLSRSGRAGETPLSSDFLQAHTTNGGLTQSPRMVPAPR